MLELAYDNPNWYRTHRFVVRRMHREDSISTYLVVRKHSNNVYMFPDEQKFELIVNPNRRFRYAN